MRNTVLLLILFFVSCKTPFLETQTENQKTVISSTDIFTQSGFVNDYENIFTEEETAFLENLLVRYQETSNREIVVITLKSVPEGTDFMQYAIKMSDKWNVGKNSNGNGLTVVLSKTLKQVRISTTEKTRHYLSDDLCKKVIDENMIPEFKNENYYDGVLLGLNELIRKWI